MYSRKKDRSGSSRRRAVLALLAVLIMAPMAARAMEEQTPLPGTQAVACTETAWANYNKCLDWASNWFERTTCDLAFEADYAWCVSVLGHRIKNGN
jgi:hypothetical protein